MKKILLLIFLLPIIFQMKAQNPVVDNIIESSSVDGIVKFSKKMQVSPTDVFKIYKNQMGLSEENEMKEGSSNTDETGYKHYRFQQYYKGFAISGAEYIIHSKDNIAISGNGNLNLSINSTPVINLNAQLAFEKAINYFKAK